MIAPKTEGNSENEQKEEATSELRNEKPKKRSRRTRKDSDERAFTCKCGKSYLSQTALKGHQKQKHRNKPKDGMQSDRKRGRPKKYIFTDSYPKEQVFFFDAKQRKPSVKNPINVQSAISSMASLIEKLPNKTSNNLLSLLTSYQPITKALEERKADDVMYEYLLQSKHLTNQRYYELMLKVLLMFREYFNQTNNDPDYSMNQTVEQLPLLTNSFLDDYLLANLYFGLDAFDQPEIAEIVLNFSLWIHENGYTSYLINKKHLEP